MPEVSSENAPHCASAGLTRRQHTAPPLVSVIPVAEPDGEPGPVNIRH
jgi:hypothetical protein